MERVQHDLDVGPVDRADIVDALLRGIDEIALEAVERLHAERDPVVGRQIGQALHAPDAPRRVGGLIGLRRTVRGPIGIERAAEPVDPGKLHLAEHIGVEAEGLLGLRVIRRGQIVLLPGSVAAGD